MYACRAKRILDILCASLLLVPCLVLIAFIALISMAVHRSWNVFFKQIRIGHQNKPFQILKLKTMVDLKDTHGNLLSDDERVTPFGLFLRRTSLDELPQLINIIKGEMSLVGPRPFTPEDCTRYCSPQQMNLRHQIRPGLTGLAQVYGRNSIDFNTRIRYDIFYAEHISLSLDTQILFRTVNVVLE